MNHRRRIVLVVLGLLAAALAPLGVAPPASAEGTVTVSVMGQGAVTGEGVNCTQYGGPDCSQFYADVELPEECNYEVHPPICFSQYEAPTVTLTASAGNNGFVFDRWLNCESPSARTCTHTVNSNVTIAAVYRDAQAPSVAAPSPSSGVRRGSVTLATTASDNAGVRKVEFFNGFAKLGEDAAAPYELTWDTTTVADGAKSITAKAHDYDGNVGTSAASGFTVDNTAPTVAVTSGPNGQTFGAGSTQTWQFTASDATSGVASPACSVVTSGSPTSFGACSSSSTHSVSGLAGGTYEFVVRATDGGGLTTTSAPRSFAIDDVAPGTSVTSGPAHGSRVRLRTVQFGFASSEPNSTFGCRVSPSGLTPPDFAACSAATTHTAAGLADGTYVFSVRATDAFGNSDATPVTRTFTVDTVAPQTTIRSGPASVVRTSGRTARATFSLTSERAAKFRCKLDGQRWRACTSRPSYVVGLGAHTLRVVAVDLAGNTDRTPAVRRWTVRRR